MIYKKILHNALLHNIKMIKNACPNKAIMAVIKAEAYGHGIKSTNMAIRGEINRFVVSNVFEAITLREYNSQSEILILGRLDAQGIKHSIAYNFHISVNSIDELKKLIDTVGNQLIKIHIKINSGMNRYGLSTIEEFNCVQKLLLENKNIEFAGLYTHFSCIENETYYLKEQSVFKMFLNALRKEFSPLVHVGGSHCITKSPTLFEFDAIRVGIATYGYGETARTLKLKKAMKIYAEVVAIRDVKPTESVGYSQGYKTTKNTRVLTCPIGYADGIPRVMNNRIIAKFQKYNLRQIGNVCMDSIMLDATELPNIPNEVCVFYDANKWAKVLKTNAYEVLTNFIKMRER